MTRILTFLTNGFPVWVLICSLLALKFPSLFTWFKGQMIVVGLGVIMLGMGMTLKLDDLKGVLKMPGAVAVGVACQFTIMPCLGWSVATFLALDQIDPSLAVGLILVSCCPGGTASNVVAYLARANVALSVLMTMCSTFAAILLTPLMTKWLAGELIEVDAWGLFRSTVQIVLVPVLAGLFLNQKFPSGVNKFKAAMPLISVVAIVLIVASIIGQKRVAILEAGWRLLLAPAVLHLGAFLLGYLIARLFGFREAERRTVSIEVGMQNSGLGAALANKHFPDTLASAPCAISAVYHCLIGSALAGIWRFFPTDKHILSGNGNERDGQ